MDELQSSQLATAIASGSIWQWFYPTLETLHVLAITTVFGSILMVDLRILGFAGRRYTVSALSAEILPYTWTAFAFAVLTGFLLFIARASDYYINFQFRMKALFLLLAGLNMIVFHLGQYRSVARWDGQWPPPAAARVSAGLSIVFWISVVIFGRWIGFTI